MSDKSRTLVTGFLAFEGFDVNPSALLAQSCSRPFELLEVSYATVDRFIKSLDPSRFDRLLMLGVAGKSSRMRTENFARNVVDNRCDVRGLALSPGPIDSDAPEKLPGNLWPSQAFARESSHRRPSDDAGDYLCNYIYWRALRRFEGQGKQIGFLHVPPLEQMSLEIQQRELAAILELIENPLTAG